MLAYKAMMAARAEASSAIRTRAALILKIDQTTFLVGIYALSGFFETEDPMISFHHVMISALSATLSLFSLTPSNAETPTPFTKACSQIDTGINDNKGNVCLIGTVQNDQTVAVILSTQPEMNGKNVAVFKNSPQEAVIPSPPNGSVPGSVVAVGGFSQTTSIWVAQILESPGPWSSAAFQSLPR